MESPPVDRPGREAAALPGFVALVKIARFRAANLVTGILFARIDRAIDAAGRSPYRGPPRRRARYGR